MATTTTNQAIRIPQSGDNPDVVDDLTKAVSDLESRVVMRFTSSSDRATRLPSPVEGQLCVLGDTDVLYIYAGATWVQIWPATGPAITSGTVVPSSGSGSNGDVFFKV